MDTDDIMDKTRMEEKRESLEASSSGSSSSRPKRIIKPKTFSDDFYVFGDCRNYNTTSKFLPQPNEGMHSQFSTSTPKSAKCRKGRIKRATTDSIQADNINNSNDCDQSGQNETSQSESDISIVIGNSQSCMNETLETVTTETHAQDDLTDEKNLSCKRLVTEKLNITEENVNISHENITVFVKKKGRKLDTSLPKRKESCVAESRKKVLSALEEHAPPDYMKDAVVSHNGIHCVSGKNRKQSDSVSLAIKYPELCEKEDSSKSSNKRKKVNKNNLDKSVRKTSKRRKIDTSCDDSNVKENVAANNTETSEASELGHHCSSKNMPEEVGSESMSHVENKQGVGSESMRNVENMQEVGSESMNHIVNMQEVGSESMNHMENMQDVGSESMSHVEKNVVASVPAKRPRGRPPRTATVPVSKEIQADSPSETSITTVPVKRGRGRPAKGAPKERQGEKLFRTTAAPVVKNKKLSSEDLNSLLTCRLCQKELKQLPYMKLHMMTDHSLIWSIDNPEGYDNAYIVVKKVGHIDCQKCTKRFRNAQYYKHHQIWCGREDEQATCEICNKTFRAMWLQQHMAAHKTQEKKFLLEGEQIEKKSDDAVEQDEDGDGPSENKKLRRNAAKNAIKLMSSLNDATEQDDASSSGGYSKESSGESSDDDEDDDDLDNEDGSKKDDTRKVKKKAKQPRPKKEEADKQGDSSTAEPTINNIWVSACNEGAFPSPKDRLRLLHDFYAVRLEGRAFPELTPRKVDWGPLTESEKEKYMPVNEESLKFTVGSKKYKQEKSEEQSLKFGHTVSYDGTAYFYAGGPVWAVEWCPIPDGAGHKQIVAVSANRTTEEPPGTTTIVDGPGLIQIWSTGLLENKISCSAEPVFEYAIAHDSGYVCSISWCPKACFDENAVDDECLKRLGLLAVGCSDGSVLIYCLPQPEELKNDTQSHETRNVFRPRPALVLVPNSMKGSGPCLCVSWQQGGDFKYISAGYGCGTVFVWDISTISPLLKVDASTFRPAKCFSSHKKAVLSICWNPQSPSMFASASFDFSMCVWNVERPDQPIGLIRRYTSHQIARCICWAGPLHNGFFSSCDKVACTDDCRVCFHGLSRAALTKSHLSLTVQEHTACTWDVSFNPFYDVLATCDAIGKVKIAQLPMIDVLCRVPGKHSWHRTKVIRTDLYHAKLSSPATPHPSQLNNLLAAQCSDDLQKYVQDCPDMNKNSHRQEKSVIHHQCDEDYQHVEIMNKTVTTQGTSDFVESDSGNAHSHIKNKSKRRKKINRHSTQDDVIMESDDKLGRTCENTENISIKDNTAAHDHIEGSTISKTNSSPDIEVSPQAVTLKSASSSNPDKADSLIKFGSSCIGRTGASLTEDSASCSKDRFFEPASKYSAACSESSLLENSTASLDAPKDDHSTNVQGDKLDTQSTLAATGELLHFNNYKKILPKLRHGPAQKVELEVFHGSNSHAVHRVRLNPHASSSLWLASGGQSGILRLDNLSSVVQINFIKR